MARQLARAYQRFQFPDVRSEPQERADTHLAAAPLSRRSAAPNAVAVTSFDWRDHVAIPAPGLQGGCNACTSFAVAATIEIVARIANSASAIAVSAGYLHTCLGHQGEADPSLICAGGIDLFRMLGLVQDSGYVLSSTGDYPFSPAACPTGTVAGSLADFVRVEGTDEARSRLLNGPIVADMYVWPDFFGYTTNQAPVYKPDMGGAQPYLHSVCVVGFDADGWIIKNSYGPDWGDGHGFATIDYASCGLLGAPPPLGLASREAFALTLG